MFQLKVQNLYDENSYTFSSAFADIKDLYKLASKYYYDDNVICIINII